MGSVISDLWNGNIAPCDHCGAHDERANQLFSMMQKQRAQLCEGFSASQSESFQKYTDYAEDYLLRMMELAFQDGFCIGSNLAGESLTLNR